MKIVYFGSSEFSVPFLKKIKVSRHEIVAVFTNSDKKKGRGLKLAQNPVKEAALSEGIKVFEEEGAGIDLVGDLSGLNFDYAVVISYGRILPREVFDRWPGRWLNLHPSMLPQYRGPSPMISALLDGAQQTGVTINDIVYEVDTGMIFAQTGFTIEQSDNLDSLKEKVISFGGPLLITVLDMIGDKGYRPFPQGDQGITYTRKISSEDLPVDWSADGKEIVNRIRAFSSTPGVYGFFNGERIKILKASLESGTARDVTISERGGEPAGTVVAAGAKEGLLVRCGGGGIIRIEILQPSGKRTMDHKSFINGYHPCVGQRFKKRSI